MHDDTPAEPIDAGIAAGFGSPPQEFQDQPATGDRNVGRRLGDFDVLGELGRGGMGIVYEARQLSLNRKVALKVLGTGLGMTARAVLRFRKEAEAAAKLHHTNIVPIYSTGEAEGTHFYAMELIEGPSLNLVIQQMRRTRGEGEVGGTEIGEGGESGPQQVVGHAGVSESEATVMPDWVAQTLCPDGGSSSSGGGNGRKLTDSSSTLTAGSSYVDTVAKMIAEVADGLDYAHNHGVVHRDMKPSNLLLSPDGRLSINDFGLARMMEQPGMTMTGEFVGSPLYMSPEQIAVGRAPLDHRTDIYSLGATLYELLTLEPPFPGEHRDQVIAQIMHKEPTRPRRINRRIPVDLETICLKAMEKDPDQRYQTAGQMAEDLRRYVNRFAISAKRAGIVGKTTKWVRRHPAVAALLVLVLVAGGVAWMAMNSLHNERLERAKEEVLVHAMSGDFEAAEQAIANAKDLGADLGWIRTLEGELTFYRGDAAEAVVILEQAVELMSDSLGARALLTIAYGRSGRWDLYHRSLNELDRMPANTPHENLLKGMALGSAFPSFGIEALDIAIEEYDSPIARAIRGITLTYTAEDTHDLDTLTQALKDVQIAKLTLQDNPVVLSYHLHAYVVAANIFDALDRANERSEMIAIAKQGFDDLEAFRAHPEAQWARIFYLEQLVSDKAALDESRENFDSYGSWMSAFALVPLLYGQDQGVQALETLGLLENTSEVTGNDLYRGYLAESDKAKAEEAFEAAAKRFGTGPSALYPQTILRFSGNRDRAVEVSRVQSNRVAQMPARMFDWYEHLVNFNSGGGISPNDLLERAGASRRAQCEARFFIAFDYFSQGDLPLARMHFEKTVETGVYRWFEYWWSKAFLRRMDANPDWPSWITKKPKRP